MAGWDREVDRICVGSGCGALVGVLGRKYLGGCASSGISSVFGYVAALDVAGDDS